MNKKILTLKNILISAVFIFSLALLFLPEYSVHAEVGSASSCGEGLICCTNPPNCSFEDFMDTVANIIVKLLELALVFVSVIFAYAGFLFLTSAGDTSKVTRARTMISKAGIGLLITLTAFLIVELITSALGLEASIINLI